MESNGLVSSQNKNLISSQSNGGYTARLSNLYRGVVYTIAPYMPDLNYLNPFNLFKEGNQTASDSGKIETSDFSIFPPVPEGYAIHPNGMYVKSLHLYSQEAVVKTAPVETKSNPVDEKKDGHQEKTVESESVKEEQTPNVQPEQTKKASNTTRRKGTSKSKEATKQAVKVKTVESEWQVVTSKKAKAACAKQVEIANQTKSSEKAEEQLSEEPITTPAEVKAAGGMISLNLNRSATGLNLALGIINDTSAKPSQEGNIKEAAVPAVIPKTPTEVLESYHSNWVSKNDSIPLRNYLKNDRLHHPPKTLLENLPNVVKHVEKSPYKGCAARVLVPCRFKLLNPNVISKVQDKGVLEIGLKENGEPYHLFYAQANTDDKKANFHKLKGSAESKSSKMKSEKKYGPYTKVNRAHPVVEDDKHVHYLEGGYQWTVYKKRD